MSIDRSGTFTGTGVSQTIMPANPGRRGYLVQALRDGGMLIDELGRDATGGSAWPLTRSQMFPPPELPATTSAVTASGITGEGWIAKEW